MIIKGKKVRLRAIEQEDLELLLEMINDEELERLVVGWSFPVSRAQQKVWFDSITNEKENIKLIVETPEDGAIGLIVVTNIDWKNRSARIGQKIARKEFRSKGIGSDALMALMRFLFDELQLHYLDSEILAYNEFARKQQEKCGWVVEGIKRKAVFKAGAYHDLYMTSILREDYENWFAIINIGIHKSIQFMQ